MTGIERIAVHLLAHPGEWEQLEYVLRHPRTGLDIWTYNGWYYTAIFRPEKINLSLRERWLLWRAIRKWQQPRIPLRGLKIELLANALEDRTNATASSQNNPT